MADDLDALARLVHEQRLAFNAELEHPRGLKPWEERAEMQQELDRRIASAVAARAVHDAGLRNERMEARLFALDANRPALLHALGIALGECAYESQAVPFRNALKALGGDEEEGTRP